MTLGPLARDALREKRSTADAVAEALRRAISTGVLRSGQPLRQEALAAEFGLSRAPIREALSSLEAQGWVVVAPNRGATVAPFSSREVFEIYEMRAALEVAALRNAVPRLTGRHLDEARLALERAGGPDGAVDRLRFSELNWAFHGALYAAADLPRLLALARSLHDQALRYLALGVDALGYRATTRDEHEAILRACEGGDADLACDRLDAHLRAAGARLVALLREAERAP